MLRKTRQGKTTQQKATQHNSPKAVIFQIACLGWDSNPCMCSYLFLQTGSETRDELVFLSNWCFKCCNQFFVTLQFLLYLTHCIGLSGRERGKGKGGREGERGGRERGKGEGGREGERGGRERGEGGREREGGRREIGAGVCASGHTYCFNCSSICLCWFSNTRSLACSNSAYRIRTCIWAIYCNTHV